jgi:hypothetical protein
MTLQTPSVAFAPIVRRAAPFRKLDGAYGSELRARARDHTPGNVKLLLPPRQSRGISYVSLANVSNRLDRTVSDKTGDAATYPQGRG